MDLSGKVAIVTGASSGIGAATVKALHGIGMKVVGFARRKHLIEDLIKNHDGRLFALGVDLSNQQQVLNAFAWVAQNIGPVHVLINNAAMRCATSHSSIIDGDLDTWNEMIDINFTSTLMLCRDTVRNMRENGIDGYIINVSSIMGLRVVNFPNRSIYSSTKAALCAMTEHLRMELARVNSKIRTCCLSPGLVRTEIVKGTTIVYDDYPCLTSEDVADTIKYLVQSPKHVQVSTMTLQAAGETF